MINIILEFLSNNFFSYQVFINVTFALLLSIFFMEKNLFKKSMYLFVMFFFVIYLFHYLDVLELFGFFAFVEITVILSLILMCLVFFKSDLLKKNIVFTTIFVFGVYTNEPDSFDFFDFYFFYMDPDINHYEDLSGLYNFIYMYNYVLFVILILTFLIVFVFIYMYTNFYNIWKMFPYLNKLRRKRKIKKNNVIKQHMFKNNIDYFNK